MKKYIIVSIILLVANLQLGCKKYIEIDPPVSSFVTAAVFESDDVASSAVTGMYSLMISSGIASGSLTGISAIGGLSADELVGYSLSVEDFYKNQLTPLSTNLLATYAVPYSLIYTSNSILEGLSSSQKLSPSIRIQLEGEAKFVRAFSYFYLVNLFGSVPITLTSDYRVNMQAKRASKDEVYRQILLDLKSAESLLTDKYVSTERVRPNLSTVQSLLARVYLYQKDWQNAEKYASLVIAKSNLYKLTGLDDVFLKNSSEAIWQLFPQVGFSTNNTAEGNLFILTSTPVNVSLTNGFALNAFELTDKRKAAWVRSFTNVTGTYYYPYKYKIRTTSTPVAEYSMIFRLAEQFLIRAEARAEQNNSFASIEDIDVIRSRAGLPLLKDINPNIDKSGLIAAIIQERKVELFSEWGHRWLDLKRLGIADMTLKSVKPNWQATDVLYPIPYQETSRNPNISQNEGY